MSQHPAETSSRSRRRRETDAPAAKPHSSVDIAAQCKQNWVHYRNAAQLLLGTYGHCILDAIPAALRHMLETHVKASSVDKLDDVVGHNAYLLACHLHDVCAGVVDDMKDATSDAYPMGADIVYMRRVLRNKAVVETSTDMRAQACNLVDAICRRDTDDGTSVGTDSIASYAAAAAAPLPPLVQPGRIGCAQIAFAYVFSSPVPSARVAQDLLIMRNEADCLKTLNETAGGGSALHAQRAACVRLTASETPALALADFEQRVARLCKHMPQVFVSAMHTLRLMGPAFFDPARTKPYALEHPIPYEYALHLEQRYISKTRNEKK